MKWEKTLKAKEIIYIPLPLLPAPSNALWHNLPSA